MFLKQATVLDGRLVAVKDEGTFNKIEEAQFVVQGHRDSIKSSLVHNSTLVHQFSTIIIVSFSVIFQFSILSTGATQAYLESEENLQRKIFVKPWKEFGLKDEKMLKLLKALYGLSKSEDYWKKTFHKLLRNDLGMKVGISGPDLFYKKDKQKLVGICATYVDYSLHTGDRSYVNISKKIELQFKCKDRVWDSLQFTDLQIETKHVMCIVHQKEYIQKLKVLSKNFAAATFILLRAQLD